MQKKGTMTEDHENSPVEAPNQAAEGAPSADVAAAEADSQVPLSHVIKMLLYKLTQTD